MEYTRRRKIGIFVIVPAMAVVPALVIAAGIGSAWFGAGAVIQDRLEERAHAAIRHVDRVLAGARETLHPLLALPPDNCPWSLSHHLAVVAGGSGYIGSLGLLSEDLKVRCTAEGAGDHPLFPDTGPERIEAEGLFLDTRRTHLQKALSAVVILRGPVGSAVAATIHPDLLLDRAGLTEKPPPFAVTLALRDGTSVAEYVPASFKGSLLDLRATAASTLSNVRVQVAMPMAARASLFGRITLYTLPLMLAIAGLAAGVVHRQIKARTSLEADFRHALQAGHVEPHYQPIVDLKTGRCIGVEMLARWRHPDLGLMRPDLFIPVAERTGLVVPMTRHLLRRACSDLRTVFRTMPEFHLAINLATAHFSDPKLVAELERIAIDTGTPLDRLIVEATERELLRDEQTALQVMAQLQKKGVGVALDDFGTGHNGLAYLQRFPADQLKIDRLFVDTIGTDSVTRPVLDGIIDLAHRVGTAMIAEGIERDRQVEYLRQRGVQYGQGFYFARPMPKDALLAYLAQDTDPPRSRMTAAMP